MIAHALKYSGVRQVGLELGRRLGYLLREERICADLLVPVPLHKRKIRERGFNQSYLIARGIAEVLGIPVRTDIVHRCKWTQSQTALSKDERKQNVANAFRGGRAGVSELRILVVDDVITTGATVEAVGAALKRSGAKYVIAVSAALAE